MNFNKKQVKFIAAVTGLGVMLMGPGAVFPGQAAAKRLEPIPATVSEPGVQLLPANMQLTDPAAVTEDGTAAAQAAAATSVQPQATASKIFAVPLDQAITAAKPAVYLKDTAMQGLADTLTKVSVVLPGRVAASTSKIDVGPGVANLDYAKVIKWQQNVDAGYERWRLDPLQVARREGKQYGFTDQDTFTIVKRLATSNLARHGEIHVKVTHKGKDYTMILVKPFGGGDAIWTTYKVVGQYKPVPPVENPGKTLFSTTKYDGWSWQQGRYLKDMAFATVVDYNYQLKKDKRIPENVLSKIKNINYDKKVVLFAYLGTAPSGGYGIGIEKVVLNGSKMTVTVRTQSPGRGAAVTMALTQPADYIVLDKAIFSSRGGVDITFVDQNGKVLSKNKLTISHR
ncbi:protease complex subunit PrcB family protein [Sporomusa termitida]|uniref:PrcB C-terminal domain-containing protein n=1 Tax=Sporomusa termitida TaxID=2377 RepID=A0A517DXR1_9FIRM|nr:protease complex subunit PrcB family protein [Sporomusa termitida]QDR82137.1 hypothetical protein SPTER_35580 [Sporomusa termitida]